MTWMEDNALVVELDTGPASKCAHAIHPSHHSFIIHSTQFNLTAVGTRDHMALISALQQFGDC